ncbi:hypothetical protein H5410_013535, partial [Solanum commersonii]
LKQVNSEESTRSNSKILELKFFESSSSSKTLSKLRENIFSENALRRSHLVQLVEITDTLGNPPFSLLHRLSVVAFSIFASWIFGQHITASRNCSVTRRLLLFTVDLILSFKALHTRTKGKDKTI